MTFYSRTLFGTFYIRTFFLAPKNDSPDVLRELALAGAEEVARPALDRHDVHEVILQESHKNGFGTGRVVPS